MGSVVRMEGSRSRVLPHVEEHTWTCIAADVDGELDAKAIGQRQLCRRGVFAFRAEADEWVNEQEAEGFTLHSGPAPLATIYFGPTDSPSNCWSVEVTRPA